MPSVRFSDRGLFDCREMRACPKTVSYTHLDVYKRQALGRAFQVQDDILDVTSTDEELGKNVGSDRVNEKTTFVTALGLEGSRTLVEELTQRAIRALDGFANVEFLIWLAQSLAKRTN